MSAVSKQMVFKVPYTTRINTNLLDRNGKKVCGKHVGENQTKATKK